MNKKHLVVGNWKMNPTSIEEARAVVAMSKKAAKNLKRTEVVICPPFAFLHLVKVDNKKIFAGVQNVFNQPAGSFTGEISPQMVRSLGGKYVIIGHSERRAMGETDELVSQKIIAALNAGLRPIVCIGEKTRNQSGEYLQFLRNQLSICLSLLKKKHFSEIIIAYEPVFAIGKSFAEAMQAREILETVLYIKKVLNDIFGKESASCACILYGGSVNWENAKAIIETGGVNGLFGGRERLNVETFPKLLTSVDAVSL